MESSPERTQRLRTLSRENATLCEATLNPKAKEEGTNQKIPQTDFVSAKKVWWDEQTQGAQRDVNEETEHYAAGGKR